MATIPICRLPSPFRNDGFGGFHGGHTMRHFLAFSLFVTLAFVLSCSREPAANPGKAAGGVADGVNVQVAPPKNGDGKQVEGDGLTQTKAEQDAAPVASDNDKYEAALTEGLVHMADQKWTQALLSFETAQRFVDTEFVRGEIGKLRQRVEQESAAKKTVGDIEKVLEEGKATEAAKLSQ